MCAIQAAADNARVPSPLLSPLDLGFLTLRNRIVMGSMHTGFEDDVRHFDDLAALYAERARGGVGAIVTGGFAPNVAGSLYAGAGRLTSPRQVAPHRTITAAAHEGGAAILLQLLHAGRYAAHPLAVAPSSVKAPISPFTPRALTGTGVLRTIAAFARAAVLAREAGYDGVEIMGSEGYLINEFLVTRTNRRTDRWGQDRRAFAVAVVRAVREAAGPDFAIAYRISVLDLVPDGQAWDEVVALAHEVEQAGATWLATGIGWHESRVPTIVSSVPRAAFASEAGRLRREVGIPVAASNRIPTPEVAEAILARGEADLVSLARPLLADPEWATKAGDGRPVNPCIACNQACLDATFARRPVSCLVNPRAGRERELVVVRPRTTRRLAVVGGGPAGMAAAVTLAERGHQVVLFEAASRLGGQFALAERVPGKEEYAGTSAYFGRRLSELGVDVRLGTRATAADLRGFEAVVLATGVRPRRPGILGEDRPNVLRYDELLNGREAGRRVAVIGAGGIGIDVCEYLTHTDDIAWGARWGVADPAVVPGGVTDPAPVLRTRQVYLLQRKTGPLGATLGRTTGWVHKASLRAAGVEFVPGVAYERIDDAGLTVTLADGAARTIQVDTVVLCAGQEPVRDLADDLRALSVEYHLIGGADVAAELDARRAIDQAVRLALTL